MAGLLDAFDSDQFRLGLGLLAAGGARGDGMSTGGRIQEAFTGMDERKKAQAKAEFEKMKMDQAREQIQQAKNAEAESVRVRGLVSGQAGQPINYQELMRQGVPYELVKQLADSQNLGRQKVARMVDVEGPNGSKMAQGFDDYGQPVGEGAPGYVAPQLINQGNKQTFAKPVTGQSFDMGMSPSNEIALRGQNMTDARARDFNAISQQTNGIKAGEKEQAANLAKSGQVASFDVMLGSLERLGKHPGLARSVGITGAFPTMPGSESANFKAELDTFQSQAFLPMVSQLKGMGALSDAEGKKLTAAVGALNPAMGEKAFRESIARITGDMSAARGRLTGENSGGAGGSWGNDQKPQAAKQAFDAKPPAHQYKGKSMTGPDGKRYQSDGLMWKEVK